MFKVFCSEQVDVIASGEMNFSRICYDCNIRWIEKKRPVQSVRTDGIIG